MTNPQGTDWLGGLTEVDMRERIDVALDSNRRPEELLADFEKLSNHFVFAQLAAYWAPQLYRRDRVAFRSFILSNLSPWSAYGYGAQQDREGLSRLREWLGELDEHDDIALYRRAYEMTVPGWGEERTEVIERDLMAAFEEAESTTERERVLRMYDVDFDLTEETAIVLYSDAPDAARPFILDRIAAYSPYGEADAGNWEELRTLAAEKSDSALRFGIYRKQVDNETWRREVLRLADGIDDATELCAALERRHPEGWHREGLGQAFNGLLEKRGRDVLPYVEAHLDEAYPAWGERDAFQTAVDLADRRGWEEFWGKLVRQSANQEEYNNAILEVLGDDSLSDERRREKLGHLAGVGGRFDLGGWGWRHYTRILDGPAARRYGEFPSLFRQYFRPHGSPGREGGCTAHFERLETRNDDALIDDLASKIVVQSYAYQPYGSQRAPERPLLEDLTRHYRDLMSEPEAFARRASSVLAKISVGAIWNYEMLIEFNQLGRLFFEDALRTYLSAGDAVRDFLEGANLHVQALGYRVLAQDDARARELAAENVDVIQACLFRNLYERTRSWGLEALKNAAVDADRARQIVRRAKSALKLPDKRYPKDDVIAMIGEILHRYPQVRGASEQPVIHEWSPS